MKVILDRFGSTDKGTFGKLFIKDDEHNKVFEAYTVEKIWADNEPFQSCIPSGSYHIESFSSERYGETFCIVGGTVSKHKTEGKKRFACLFHAANLPRNVQGCIGLGQRQGYLDGEWSVSSSKAAVEDFLQILYKAEGNIPFLIRPPVSF